VFVARPNVCHREENTTEPASAETEGDFYSTQCSNDGRVYRCLSRVGRNGTVHSRHGVYECCLGFRRKPGEAGCTESESRAWEGGTDWGRFLPSFLPVAEVDVGSLAETLREYNLTRFADSLDGVDLARGSPPVAWTFFAPTDEALRVRLARWRPESPPVCEVVSRVSCSGGQRRGVRPAQPRRPRRPSLVRARRRASPRQRPEQRLGPDQPGPDPGLLGIAQRTGAAQDRLRDACVFQTVTANCVPVERADAEASNGIVHVVSRVLPFPRLTLWQLLEADPRFGRLRSRECLGARSVVCPWIVRH
jgi:Fasciclin domain